MHHSGEIFRLSYTKTPTRGNARQQRKTTRMSAKKKIAWITGGGTGIGLGGAQELAKDGWAVIISGRRKEVLDEAAATVKGGAEVMLIMLHQVTAKCLRFASTANALVEPANGG